MESRAGNGGVIMTFEEAEHYAAFVIARPTASVADEALVAYAAEVERLRADGRSQRAHIGICVRGFNTIVADLKAAIEVLKY